MSIWIALWALISLALIGFLVWSLFILFKQKTVWKAFANKYKLRYKKNALMDSPEMGGAFDDYKISFFTSEHLNPDARGVRKLIAIEVGLNSEMPFEGAIASGGMVAIIKELGFPYEVRPEHKSWDQSYIATANSKAALDAYLKDDRVKALSKILSLKNSWGVLIFRKGQTLLRVDTPNPLDTENKLESLSSMMVKIAKILELDAGEFKKLKAEAAKAPEKAAAAVLDDSAVDGAGGLSLEDDDDEGGQEDTPEKDSEDKETASPSDDSKDKKKS